MLKKNKLFILFGLLLGLTSCSPKCSNQGRVEIPSAWYSPIDPALTEDNPACFLWWEALDDPLLTSLIMGAAERNRDVLMAAQGPKSALLKTINDVSAEVAKNYVEYRGLQLKLNNVKQAIEASKAILLMNKDLAKRGFFSLSEEYRDEKNNEAFIMQQSATHFSMQKIIFHLATLLNYPPESVAEMLCEVKDLSELRCENPIGSPKEFICYNLAVEEARKQYKSCPSKLSLYSYQKTALEALENAETALAAFNFQRDKLGFLEHAKLLSFNSYQLTKDLDLQGLKSDGEMLQAYLEFLESESAAIQGQVDLWTSYINLYHTIGSSWEVCP